nr:leukocyte elastase inhibitor A-like [Penaeus vannamei]
MVQIFRTEFFNYICIFEFINVITYGSQEANQNYTINSANRIYFDQSIPVRECVGKVLDDKVKFTDFNRVRNLAYSFIFLPTRCGESSSLVTSLHIQNWISELMYLQIHGSLQPDAAAAEINAFINAETRGKIPKLIEPSFVEDAKMVLTNAVYMHTLQKMGIRDLFFSTADLTNFTPVRGLLVNGAIHKALIEVDEEGAEAAAATAFVLNRSRSMPPKTTFTCNRPFVFFIQDNEANNILFMGFIGVLEGPLLDLVIMDHVLKTQRNQHCSHPFCIKESCLKREKKQVKNMS